MDPPNYRRIIKNALVEHWVNGEEEILQSDPADPQRKRIRPKEKAMIKDLEGIIGCPLEKEVIRRKKQRLMEESGGNMTRLNTEQRVYMRRPHGMRRMALYEPNAGLFQSKSQSGSSGM
jgi:hypothetical protein